ERAAGGDWGGIHVARAREFDGIGVAAALPFVAFGDWRGGEPRARQRRAAGPNVALEGAKARRAQGPRHGGRPRRRGGGGGEAGHEERQRRQSGGRPDAGALVLLLGGGRNEAEYGHILRSVRLDRFRVPRLGVRPRRDHISRMGWPRGGVATQRTANP